MKKPIKLNPIEIKYFTVSTFSIHVPQVSLDAVFSFSVIQGSKFLTWVYTPGAFGVLQLLWPHDVTPSAMYLPVK